MKLELAWLSAASASSAIGAAGAAMQLGDGPATLALMGVGGLCAIIGALFYRSNGEEGVVRDVLVSIAMAFVFGAAAGDVAGRLIDSFLFKSIDVHLTLLSQHMIGGAALGFALTPFTRALLSGAVADFLGAMQAFVDKLKGGER